MKVIIAEKSGFCWGVRRAVNIVLEAKQKNNKTVFTYGPLIHNSIVINDLKSKGIDIYKDGDKVPPQSSLVIRAHGIAPKSRANLEGLGFELINATCPHVMRAQDEVKKYHKQQYSIIIAGDRNHAEVVGLLGFAGDNAVVVGDTEEVKKLEVNEPVLFLAQTTFNHELFERMKKELLKKYKDVRVVDTICLSTSERQYELLSMSKEVDAIVVVGDRASANTMRLVSIARDSKKPVYFIQDSVELNVQEMAKYKIVGITAGASTPDSVTKEVARKLEAV